ncbi:MAG: hypothetical protein ACTSRA_19530, partial [Promethearchaeota archaeon]
PQASWFEKLTKYPPEKDIASLIRALSYIKINAFKKIIDDNDQVMTGSKMLFDKIHPFFFLLGSAHVKAKNLINLLINSIFKEPVSLTLDIIEHLNIWELNVANSFLKSYNSLDSKKKLNPILIKFFIVQRTMDEILYESQFRPENIFTPISGFFDELEKMKRLNPQE